MNRLAAPLERVIADAELGDWRALVEAWLASVPGRSLQQALDRRIEQGAEVFPARIFQALELTPLAQTRVVILGQDPYHGPGQAEGLAFSVPDGVAIPPSLRNLFKELQRDLGLPPPRSGSLRAWSAQGVLLLNGTLTVEAGRAASHARLGWQALTDALLTAVVADRSPKVLMLWGAHAQAQAARVLPANHAHAVLQANHPSPLSALRPPTPFLGCGHFGIANRFLQSSGRTAVKWALA